MLIITCMLFGDVQQLVEGDSFGSPQAQRRDDVRPHGE